jgi:hypothetical protein
MKAFGSPLYAAHRRLARTFQEIFGFALSTACADSDKPEAEALASG